MIPRRLSTLVTTAALALVAASCAGTGDGDVAEPGTIGEEVASSDVPEAPSTTKAEATGAPSTGLLYVAQAGSAEIEGDWPTVTVTMSEVDAEMLWFQDRPGRDAGEMRTAEFVDQWDEVGFGTDPPNAVIRHDAGDGLGTVVEMSDPVWDQPSGSLSFTATAADHQPGDEPLPWLMSDVSLFIDDSGSGYQQVRLDVSNAQPGQKIGVELSSASSPAPSWSLGPDDDSAGASLSAQSGSIPLQDLTVNDSEISLQTSGGSGGSSMTLEISLYLAVPTGTSEFYARTTSDPGVEVQMAIGDAEPQVVDQTDTSFEVGP